MIDLPIGWGFIRCYRAFAQLRHNVAWQNLNGLSVEMLFIQSPVALPEKKLTLDNSRSRLLVHMWCVNIRSNFFTPTNIKDVCSYLLARSFNIMLNSLFLAGIKHVNMRMCYLNKVIMLFPCITRSKAMNFLSGFHY